MLEPGEGLDLLGQVAHVVPRVQTSDEDHELVAAEAEHRVARGDRAEVGGDVTEHVIAPVMAQLVVDGLEAVEVDVHDRPVRPVSEVAVGGYR